MQHWPAGWNKCTVTKADVNNREEFKVTGILCITLMPFCKSTEVQKIVNKKKHSENTMVNFMICELIKTKHFSGFERHFPLGFYDRTIYLKVQTTD